MPPSPVCLSHVFTFMYASRGLVFLSVCLSVDIFFCFCYCYLFPSYRCVRRMCLSSVCLSIHLFTVTLVRADVVLPGCEFLSFLSWKCICLESVYCLSVPLFTHWGMSGVLSGCESPSFLSVLLLVYMSFYCLSVCPCRLSVRLSIRLRIIVFLSIFHLHVYMSVYYLSVCPRTYCRIRSWGRLSGVLSVRGSIFLSLVVSK